MKLYLSSILLEPKRWAKEKTGLLDLSDWTPRMRKAGFAGWDLWEFHDSPAGAPAVPEVGVYNTYLLPEEATEEEVRDLAGRIVRSGARGVKFNLGSSPNATEKAVEPLLALLERCPGTEFWCECHPRTALEDPKVAIPWIARLPDRVGVILHAFNRDQNPLDPWGIAAPDRVRHLHVQVKGDNKRFALLADHPGVVRERLEHLRALGYTGDASLEFTRGVAAGEDDEPGNLFAAACADLVFFQSCLNP